MMTCWGCASADFLNGNQNQVNCMLLLLKYPLPSDLAIVCPDQVQKQFRFRNDDEADLFRTQKARRKMTQIHGKT